MHLSRISVTATSIAKEIVKYFINAETSAQALSSLQEFLPNIKTPTAGILSWLSGNAGHDAALKHLIDTLKLHKNKEVWTSPEDELQVIVLLYNFFKTIVDDVGGREINSVIVWKILQEMKLKNKLTLAVNEELCNKIVQEKSGKVFVDSFEIEVKVARGHIHNSTAVDNAQDQSDSEHTIFEDSDPEPESVSTKVAAISKSNTARKSMWQHFWGLPVVFGDPSDVFVHAMPPQGEQEEESDDENTRSYRPSF